MAAAVESIYGETFGAGAVLGSYLVDRLAFEGGFAALYEARHGETGERAAVKVLHALLARSTKMLQRFQREAEAIRKLEHPGIVRLHEVGELTDGRPYIAMEWLPGNNLTGELAARGPLTAREALAVVDAVGDALGAAHELGIVHRDLKAQNVMAVPEGDWFEVKLVDFGIAKMREPGGQLASLTSQTVLGTPQTAAPEQITGRPVDARTDIYALGQLLFQLVTGRLPFEARSAVELEEMHLHQPVPRASEIAPVPAALDSVIERAMAKHPDDRYGVTAAFLQAAHAAVRGAAPAPEPPSVADGVGLWITARPTCDDERALEAIDSLLALAEEKLAGAGLAIALDTPSAILAVAKRSPAAGEATRAVADELAAAAPGILGDAPVELAIAVHTGGLERRAGQWVGGDLLRPGSWPASAFLVPAE